MSPFDQMCADLAAKHAFPTAPATTTPKAKGPSTTGAIRDLLKKAHRPMTAAEIAFDMALEGSGTVWLLMKYDLQKGRVLLVDGLYRWNHDYDLAEAIELRAAVKLLKRAKYQIKPPRADK